MVKKFGELLFTIGDVAAIIFKEPATIRGWDKYSDMLEQEAIEKGTDGSTARLIPKAVRVNGRRLYSWEQTKEIIRFSEGIIRGTLSEYSRTRNGIRGKEIVEKLLVEKEQNEVMELNKLLDKVSTGIHYDGKFKFLKDGTIWMDNIWIN